MKKIVVLAAVAFGFTAVASANLYSDFDSIYKKLIDTSSGRSYQSTFSVVNEDAGADIYTAHGSSTVWSVGPGAGTTVLGYTPGDTIIGAKVSFGLWDNDTAKEKVKFYLGNNYYLGESPGDQISGYKTYTFDLFSVLNSTVLGSVLGDLSDGTISYKVSMLNNWSSENVWLKWASLNIETAPKQVPDGGATLVLLGLGVFGLAIGRRRI